MYARARLAYDGEDHVLTSFVLIGRDGKRRQDYWGKKLKNFFQQKMDGHRHVHVHFILKADSVVQDIGNHHQPETQTQTTQ